MYPLLRKDCLWFLLLTVGFVSTAVLFSFGSAENGDTDYRIVYQIGLLQVGLVCFSLFSSELKESYRFLQILPVSAAEIVASKFLLVLTQVSVYWVILLLLFWRADWPSSDLSFAVGVINTCAILSLLLAASWYWGIFRYGFSTAMKILSFFCFCALVVVILLADLFEGRASDWLTPARPFLGWILPVASALLLYFLLMRVATRAKINGEVDR
ncbi:ABC-2 transporter permease [Gemmatimonadota bacterium]